MGNNDIQEKTKLDQNLWKQLFVILLRQKKTMILVGILVFITSILDVIFPLLNSYALDTLASGNASQQTFTTFVIMYVVMVIAFALCVYTYLHLTGIVENQFAYDLRKMAFDKVQSLSFSYFDKNSEGWIISRLTSDITRLTEIMSWGFMDAVFGLISIIGISIIMLVVNFRLALLILIVVIPLVFISNFFQKRILEQQRLVRKQNSEVTAAFSESINGAKTIKSLAIENEMSNDFKTVASRMRKSSLRANFYSALFMPVIIFLSGISMASIIWYGGHQVIAFAMPFGMLLLFTSYVNMFYQPLRELARLLAELQMAQASAERVLQLITSKNDVTDRADIIEKYGTLLKPKLENYEAVHGDIEFKNVNFHYNPNEPVLKDFNLKVAQGQTVALVGETGSGKSTIVNLLCRFYEPVSGEVLIDGLDYRERSIGWLRHHIGYVLQAPHLFSGTIMENIRYGCLDATDEEVISAAKQVNAHSFIMSFKDGYETEVKEGGSRLSTGQKQLISFARAIIKEPALYILDEATASIDSETEQIVQEAIDKILSTKTSFIVAHRLSTIVNADIILVIDKGEISESGTHQQLMALKGRYYNLYTNQYIEEENQRVLKRNVDMV